MRYEIGNANLKSERATQFDVNYEFDAEHISLIVNPFYNYIVNYIQLSYQDSIIDGLPVFKHEQTPIVHLYGADVGIHYHPHFAHWLHIESSYSLIRAEDRAAKSVSLMPQARVNSFLKVRFKGKRKIRLEQLSAQHQYFFRQENVASYETVSEGYHLFNVGMDLLFDFKSPLKLGLGMKNVLNEDYINHLSRLKNIGMSHPGRNFYVNLKYSISGKMKRK